MKINYKNDFDFYSRRSASYSLRAQRIVSWIMTQDQNDLARKYNEETAKHFQDTSKGYAEMARKIRETYF